MSDAATQIVSNPRSRKSPDSLSTLSDWVKARRPVTGSFGYAIKVLVTDVHPYGDGFRFVVTETTGGDEVQCCFTSEAMLHAQSATESAVDWTLLAGRTAILLLVSSTNKDCEYDVTGFDFHTLDDLKAIQFRRSMRSLIADGRASKQHCLPEPIKVTRVAAIVDTDDPLFGNLVGALTTMLPQSITVQLYQGSFGLEPEKDGSVYKCFAAVHGASKLTPDDPYQLILLLGSGEIKNCHAMSDAMAQQIVDTPIPVIVGMPRGLCRSLVHSIAFEGRDSIRHALSNLRQLAGCSGILDTERKELEYFPVHDEFDDEE